VVRAGKLALEVLLLLRWTHVALSTEEAREHGGSSCCDITRGHSIVLYPPTILLYGVAGVNPRAASGDCAVYSRGLGASSVPDYC